MKITDLTQQKNNPHRYNLAIDGKFKLGVDETVVLEYHLKVGEEISEKDFQAIEKSESNNKARDRALQLLGNRVHSRKELVLKLTQKGFGTEQIEETLKYLDEQGYLDDEEFAVQLVKVRKERNPKGSIFVRRELLQKGVAEEIIEKVIAEHYPLCDEIEIARKVMEKKIGSDHSRSRQDYFKEHQRLKQFLIGRGFQFEVIDEVLEDIEN